ncbi:hypothetical protein DPMN_066802 [Dreissena polymorpha]|uniref:Uncharacterized protein n=1 Tax=Dreissena polymorpha TaxID=45954 RepID=A0A9D3YY39_DREPO|nr:hypothetical protein DPMN_066802 [Dreissena polymorpha]
MYRRIACNRREGSGDNRTTAAIVLDGPGKNMCSRTVKGLHGQPKHTYGCLGALNSTYTDQP